MGQTGSKFIVLKQTHSLHNHNLLLVVTGNERFVHEHPTQFVQIHAGDRVVESIADKEKTLELVG